MGWIKNLLTGRQEGKDPLGYWVYVQCDRCGENLATRINLQNDLSLRFENGEQSYFLRKVLVGGTGCFQRVEIALHFDEKRRLLNREIQGGEFITEAEYHEAQDLKE